VTGEEEDAVLAYWKDHREQMRRSQDERAVVRTLS
jgi:hypothetical protein